MLSPVKAPKHSTIAFSLPKISFWKLDPSAECSDLLTVEIIAINPSSCSRANDRYEGVRFLKTRVHQHSKQFNFSPELPVNFIIDITTKRRLNDDV